MAYAVFDLHCDTADRLAWQCLDEDLRRTVGMDFYGPGDAGDPDGCRELARNRGCVSLELIGDTPWAQCFACFVPDELSPEQAARFYGQVGAHLGTEVARNAGVALARSGSEVRPALARGLTVAARTLENARLFAFDLGLVGSLAQEGLLMASLSWNAEGPLASGHDSHAGLSPLGRAALCEMEREGVVLDVSHLNDECFDEAAALARRPFVASHSNSRAVCGHPRNLTDRQFCCIRDRGGLVGLNFCSGFISEGAWDERAKDVTFEQLAAHIEHWLDLGGEDVVALGSDFDGADVPSFIAGASRMPGLQALLEERFGAAVTAKLCAENALAFFEREAA